MRLSVIFAFLSLIAGNSMVSARPVPFDAIDKVEERGLNDDNIHIRRHLSDEFLDAREDQLYRRFEFLRQHMRIGTIQLGVHPVFSSSPTQSTPANNGG